jgi:hypothetical protein
MARLDMTKEREHARLRFATPAGPIIVIAKTEQKESGHRHEEEYLVDKARHWGFRHDTAATSNRDSLCPLSRSLACDKERGFCPCCWPSLASSTPNSQPLLQGR